MSGLEQYVATRSVLLDEDCMALALDVARRAKAKGDLPIGAALVWPKRHFAEHNTSLTDSNPLNTAVMRVLSKAYDMLPHRVAEGVLYCTVEPDAFSVLGAWRSGIMEVVFGVYDPKDGFVSSKSKPLDLDRFDVKYKGGVKAEECFELLPSSLQDYCSITAVRD